MDGVREFLERRLGGDREETEPSADSDAVALAEELAANPETITLDDGRQLGYAECGDPDGVPLLVYHGFPNSRVFGALFDDVGRERGIRVITPDRPGMGVSDPDPDRTLLDWPDDVRQLLDALEIDETSVVGISGGGPYAAATAARLGDRVSHVGIVCGLGPMAAVGLRERLWYYTARFAPSVSKLALWVLVQRARGDPAEWLESLAENAHPSDEALWQGEVGQILHASAAEAHRHHGLDPLVQETALYGRPWPFDLEDIEVPVTLWYGKPDTLVPVEMGLYLAREIPTAEAHIYPDLDHLSIVTANETDIVETVAGAETTR
jgi:pimeloyl-ACP methyl ester carboxylesterase